MSWRRHWYQLPPAFIGGPAPYYPKRPVPPPTVVAAADNPPFQHRGRDPRAPIIARWWEPPEPYRYFGAGQPLTQLHLPLDATAVAVDDPPPNTHAWHTLRPGDWTALWWPAQHPPSLIQETAPALADLPFERAWLQIVLDQWRPITWPAQHAPALPVDVTAVAVDDPPPNTHAWHTLRPGDWTAMWWPAQHAPSLIQEAAPALGDLPFERAWLQIVLDQWRPIAWPAQHAPSLPIDATAVAVNDPPFGVRAWLRAVLDQWRPPNWPSQHAASLPQEGVVVPPTGSVYIPTFRRRKR